jgi:hypothetical protein
MGKSGLILLVAFVASPLDAKPVYLSCKFTNNDGSVRDFAVTFDEETQTASYTAPTGFVQKLPNVVFNPNEVIASNSEMMSSGILDVEQWEISRVTGAVVRTTTMSVPRYPQIKPTTTTPDNGICAPVKQEPRKF